MKEALMSNDIDFANAAGVSGAILKALGVPIVAAAVASAFGFCVMWPRTLREAFFRFATAVFSSIFIGPFFVILVNSWKPEWFSSASALAALYGAPVEYGYLVLGGVLIAFSALPVWFVGGAVARFASKRKDKDLGEIVHDVVAVVHDARTSI